MQIFEYFNKSSPPNLLTCFNFSILFFLIFFYFELYRGEGGINFKNLIFFSELFYSQEGEVTWIEGKVKKIIFYFFLLL